MNPHLLQRPRRLRDHALLRESIAETHVGLQHLMLPVFVGGNKQDMEIPGMPGVLRHSMDGLRRTVSALLEKGLQRFIIFGVPNDKSPAAQGATDPEGIIPKALLALREEVGRNALLATDVCLCSYTDTGHCGVLDPSASRVDNDPSVALLAKTALAHAHAGADMVAPSDMMDGRVKAIRQALDDAGKAHIPIMSYAVKYASSLYGPFRHAADSAPQVGDRRGYQMDVRNGREAVREALLDAEEGADILMVKPGIAYLDILAELRTRTHLPLAIYQVSGEYAMLKAAAQAGAIDERAVALELWLSMRRAGAQLILSYHAAMAAQEGWLA